MLAGIVCGKLFHDLSEVKNDFQDGLQQKSAAMTRGRYVGNAEVPHQSEEDSSSPMHSKAKSSWLYLLTTPDQISSD